MGGSHLQGIKILPKRINWLRDLLPSQFPKARIMTFEHNVDWLIKAPLITAYETAGLLLRELK